MIGKTGKGIFPVALGGRAFSWARDRDERSAIRAIHAALDAGISLIDTADTYSLNNQDIGHNEQLIRRALRRNRGHRDVYVATKGGFRIPYGKMTQSGSPASLRMSLEASLRNLGVDSVFLYYLHGRDPRVDIEISLNALKCLQREGKIQHLGVSNLTFAEVKKAKREFEIEAVQNHLNAFDPSDLKSGLVKFCEQSGMTYFAYSPVGGPFLHDFLNSHEILRRISEKHGVSSYQVLLAWALAQSGRIVPITGASRIESIRDSARAVRLKLDSSDLRELAGVGKRVRKSALFRQHDVTP